MTLTAIDRFSASYGPVGRQGILSEHLASALESGLDLVELTETRWLVGEGGRALPLLCSELVEIPSWEDSEPLVGRCGELATHPRLGTCARHTVAMTGSEEPDLDATCEHGMAAWLCAGPMHYPADM